MRPILGPPREKDRPFRVGLCLALLLAGVVAVLLAKILAYFPNFVERVYTEHLGQWAGRLLAMITRWYPYSVGELLLAGCLLGTLFLVVRAVYEVVGGRRRLSNALLCGLLRLGAALGVLLLFFYTAWGFNYSRADLITRLQWRQWARAPEKEAAIQELDQRCSELVQAANEAYATAMGSPDAGHASTAPISRSEINRAIDAAYQRVGERLKQHPSFAVSRGPAKPMLFSFVMSNLLISGIYCPYTGEANYDWEGPECSQPEVIAHEKAHQRGVTSEDEANFFGFLVCAASDQPYLRYSAFLMAQRQLLGELGKHNPDRVKELVKQRHPGIQRDVDAIKAFYNAHAGRVSRVQHRMNDLYLKANGVKGGVMAYQASAKLILTYARSNGGSCLFDKDEPAKP